MDLGPTVPAQRTLAMAAAVLILIGLITGFLAAAAMSGQLAVDGHSMLAAHLNALLGSFWMVAVAWSMPMLRYGPSGQGRLSWLVIVPNYANWFITAIKAVLQVKGVAKTGEARNDAIFFLLGAFVVLPSLAAATGWIAGFRRSH